MAVGRGGRRRGRGGDRPQVGRGMSGRDSGHIPERDRQCHRHRLTCLEWPGNRSPHSHTHSLGGLISRARCLSVLNYVVPSSSHLSCAVVINHSGNQHDQLNLAAQPRSPPSEYLLINSVLVSSRRGDYLPRETLTIIEFPG